MHGSHHGKQLGKKERMLLLKHMLEHQKSHSRELHGIVHDLEEDKASLLHEIVLLYEEADQKFEDMLHFLGED